MDPKIVRNVYVISDLHLGGAYGETTQGRSKPRSGYEEAKEYSDAANELFKGGFRYVLFGHTHLAKKVELQPGWWYLNSGTWADLMQLPPEIITASPADARAKLEPFVQDIAEGQLNRWIVFRPTYIQLDLDADNHVINADVVTWQKSAAAAQ